MTQRDWQKDMDVVQALKGNKVADVMCYWLQEAKKLSDLAEELNNEVFSANCERETLDQTMKVGLERALKTTDPYEMLQVIQHLYSTLYPDTPAPKEGE